MLPRSMQFNKVVGHDLLEINFRGTSITCSNAVCWGTGLVCVNRLRSGKSSKDVRDDFAEQWAKHVGWPELVVTDQGPEYVGPEWNTALAQHGVIVTRLTRGPRGSRDAPKGWGERSIKMWKRSSRTWGV